ncbi:MAG: DUF3108 domain-containing protein [Gammaproteobacteria bacterium]|nr:DUF3108 domain-containing protein [Gammaproteobacteria bacterium]MBU1654220.1 DUF3108 domain-containing protein [Gammaproteobacteria bacterium]
MKRIYFPALFLLVCWLPAKAGDALKSPAFLGERLDYRISYRGFFSLGKLIDIANATLSTPARVQSDGTGRIFEADLSVTTENHGILDSVAPFRYRARTFYRIDPQGTALFSVLLKSKKKSGQYLYQVDSANGQLVRYRQQENDGNPNAGHPPARLMALHGEPGPFSKDRVLAFKAGTPLLDRLSLLQFIRTREFAPGRSFQIAATDGSDLYAYSIRVEKQEKITLAGRAWDTWRLRFEGTKQKDNGRSEEAHSPIRFWISIDANHLPVRAEVEHKFGLFAMALVSARRE